jgi:hypothetical protein
MHTKQLRPPIFSWPIQRFIVFRVTFFLSHSGTPPAIKDVNPNYVNRQKNQ